MQRDTNPILGGKANKRISPIYLRLIFDLLKCTGYLMKFLPKQQKYGWRYKFGLK